MAAGLVLVTSTMPPPPPSPVPSAIVPTPTPAGFDDQSSNGGWLSVARNVTGYFAMELDDFPPARAMPPPTPPSPAQWAKELKQALTNYTKSQTRHKPKDVMCTSIGPFDASCECWDDHGKHHDNGKNCNKPKNCLIDYQWGMGTFQFSQLQWKEGGSPDRLDAELDKWGVPAQMKKTYSLAAMTTSSTFQTFDFDLNTKPTGKNTWPKATYEAHSGALRNDGNGSVYVGYVYGWGVGALTFPKVRTSSPGHCKASQGGASYVKPRGFHTDELLTIEQQLQYTAFQSAALMATGQCWPKKWGVGDCDQDRNSGCCSGKCRKYPNAQLPQVVGECA